MKRQIKTFEQYLVNEEYRLFKVRKNIPGFNFNTGNYEDVPNKYDKKEPFFNKNKQKYWDETNKKSEIIKKENDIYRAECEDRAKKMKLKVKNLISSGILNPENISEVREIGGFYREENDYYKFILNDGRKFKYTISYYSYDTGGRADFFNAKLIEYDSNGNAINKWEFDNMDENMAEQIANTLQSKLNNKWEFGEKYEDIEEEAEEEDSED